ncbi:MAG: ATPase domain-containing protein [Thermoplasmatota archaeon]
MKQLAERETIKTGIDGLDKTLHGGIPEGHVVLLTGDSGTGKTILSMQWLFEGWKNFEQPGIYISVTEPFTKAIKNISTMDFYYPEPVESGNLRFTDLRSMIELMEFGKKDGRVARDEVDELVNRIEELVDKTGARRMVIDSITAVGYMIDDKELFRYLIFRLGTVLSGKKCTVFLTSESREGSSPFHVEDFISDGIIKLEYTHGEQSVIRKIEISKMRGVDFRTGNVFFDIDSQGIKIYPKIPIEREIAKTNFEKRLKTGDINLDEMLNGGYPEGHIILVTGNTGTGKTTLGLQFLVEGLKNSEKGVFINLEEPIPQVKKTADSHGWNFTKYEEEGILKFVSPELIDTYPDKFVYEILNVVDENDAKRIVLDSISSLPSAGLSEDKLREILLQLNSALKARGVTAVMTHLTSGLFSQSPDNLMGTTQASDLRLSSLCDGIILLRYVERDNQIGKVMTILKMRGSDHAKYVRELKITDTGVEIGDVFEKVKE